MLTRQVFVCSKYDLKNVQPTLKLHLKTMFFYARGWGLERHVKNIPVVYLEEWVGSWKGWGVNSWN